MTLHERRHRGLKSPPWLRTAPIFKTFQKISSPISRYGGLRYSVILWDFAVPGAPHPPPGLGLLCLSPTGFCNLPSPITQRPPIPRMRSTPRSQLCGRARPPATLEGALARLRPSASSHAFHSQKPTRSLTLHRVSQSSGPPLSYDVLPDPSVTASGEEGTHLPELGEGPHSRCWAVSSWPLPSLGSSLLMAPYVGRSFICPLVS